MAFDSLRDFLSSLRTHGRAQALSKLKSSRCMSWAPSPIIRFSKKDRPCCSRMLKVTRPRSSPTCCQRIKKWPSRWASKATMRAMFEKFLSGFKNPIVPVEVKGGPCKEEIYKDDAVDITKFPTPVWHEKDAGPYLGTFHGCITKDRATGDQNMGMYRLPGEETRKLSGCRFTATVWRTTVSTKRRTNPCPWPSPSVWSRCSASAR